MSYCKKIALWILLSVPIGGFPSLAKGQQLRLFLVGEVTKEPFSALASTEKAIGFVNFAYRITVTASNNGSFAFSFDEVVATFAPRGKASLRLSVYQLLFDERRGTDWKKYQGDKKQVLAIGPEENGEWDFTTNGYTRLLLIKSGEFPLDLWVDFRLKGKTVAGTFRSFLPRNLRRVPIYDRNKKGHGIHLRFYQK